MAIQFARIEIVGRSSGGNACCNGAYNARTIIKDEQTNVTYNFTRKGDNVYHEILLPKHVDQKFKNTKILMNTVEQAEKRKDNQLLKDIVLALPDDKELNLKDRIEITYRLIAKRGWVREGLAVQMDIHEPHDGEKNWHAHLLVTTRRFNDDGLSFGLKAVDLNPSFIKVGSKAYAIPEEEMIHEELKEIINDYFKELGLENRVDLIGTIAQEHIGPVRMRSVLNQVVDRNEEKRLANIEHLSSGKGVLDKITKHMSVFSKNDLMRAAKPIPDAVTADKLVEDALSDKSLVELFDESGTSTGYYTTDDVREDELKLLRLSSYVSDQKNILLAMTPEAMKRVNSFIDKFKDSLTEEQHSALSHLLLDKSGIRIMRGRAGTGKSHVLGKIASISEAVGVNVIGLSPTHKASRELAKCGYKKNDTIKGMLFKLYNGRFEVLKNSLLVVDEAGMVGNDDYHELLRVAASRKCNVILAGDERQLSSVQRGGMFEIFADRYGSASLLNIKRQDSTWGKSVAMAFSNGEARTGIGILQQHNRIISSNDKISNMEALLLDWHKSKQSLENKLIIAVKNKDVDILNLGARQYLKASGYLQGKEIAIGVNHYMHGDRILIKQTNKELGLNNGDLLEITHVSKEQFTVKNAAGKEISFDPSKYNGFRHGYATTVFKAQGVSINDVFVLHDGFATIRNSYVALSRNVKDLNLYINNQATRSTEHLIKQLSYDPDSSSSLNYFTKGDLEKNKLNSDFDTGKGIFASLVVGTMEYGLKKITEFTDKNLALTEYYHYEAPELKKERVETVLDNIGYELAQEAMGVDAYVQDEVRAVAGGNLVVTDSSNIPNNINKSITSNDIEANAQVRSSIINNKDYSTKGCSINNASNVSSASNSNRTKISAKERFYAKADYMRGISRNAELKEKWDSQSERLRSEVRFKSEQIARDLLGEPNKRLSDGKTLRYGQHGKLAVRIQGESKGTWYDFSAEKGGDMFALVQDKLGCDFKSAADYLRQSVGMAVDSNNYLQLVHDHKNSDLTEKYIKTKQAEERLKEQKQAQVNKLSQRAKDIAESSVAFQYLTNTRGISCNLGNDLKTAGIYVNEKNRYLPALIAFARDTEGNITGGQQILLRGDSGLKADIAAPKKSFGKISGSFVDLGHCSYNSNVNNGVKDKDSNLRGDLEANLTAKITIIAEGLETALSVKQALGSDVTYSNKSIKILCSLGISNISNYQPDKGEKIIIAADNDGQQAITNKTIDAAKMALEGKGAFVKIVRPHEIGDFNDMLISSGKHDIQNAFSEVINKHTATSLSQYLAICNKIVTTIKLNEQDRENLAYIQKYDLSEKDIVEAYRKGEVAGAIELEHSRKSLEFAATCYRQNKQTLLEAKQWGYKDSEVDATKAMLGLDEVEANSFCEKLRDSHLEQYLKQNISIFSKQKEVTTDIQELKPIITLEQKFLKETYESLKSPINERSGTMLDILSAGEIASKQPELLNKIFVLADKLITEYGLLKITICQDTSHSVNTGHLYAKLDKAVELAHINHTIAKLDNQVSVATSPYEAIEALDNKQKFCASLYQNLRYQGGQDYLQELTAVAKAFQLEKIPKKLQAVVKTSIELGIRSEESLLKELRTTKNSRDTYRKLDGELEIFRINNTLALLDKSRQQSQNPQKTIELWGARDRFLAGLQDNLKYPELHNEALMKSIQNADKNEQNNILQHLDKIVTLHITQVGTKVSEINKILKSSQDTGSAFSSLEKSYKSHVLSEIHQSLKVIGSGKIVEIDNKNFNCPIKFLGYVIKTRTHEYFPHKEVEKMQSQAIERQKQLVLSKDMGGL